LLDEFIGISLVVMGFDGMHSFCSFPQFLIFGLLAPFTGGAGSFYNRGNTMKSLQTGRRLQIATWNIAAINNNPFEYWITYKENPAYEELMVNVEKFLEEPGDNDVLVPNVFTQQMFEELDQRLTGTAGWKSVRSYWDDDFSKRKIIENFMKDPSLGSKRLASMPDRYTNTINTKDGKTVFRPTVINMYEDDLSTQDIWWKKWQTFMFDSPLKIKDGKTGEVESKAPYAMLQPILKAKYPEISEEESVDSLPLQTMCGAIFDAILVYMMNTVSTPDVWQPLKRTMVDNLNRKKVPHTLQILEQQYLDSDIITLQEVSSQFIDMARASPLGQTFHIIASSDMDPVRDQNSVICLRKSTFPNGAAYIEITKEVTAAFPTGLKVPVSAGDILAIATNDAGGEKFVIASFHGDTNGLATKPVTDAIVKAMATNSRLSDHKLIFGLDANTYEHAVPGKTQDVLDYATNFAGHGLLSCWGETINPANYTTYNARTFLQPQLNKACRQSEKRSSGDVNPKDFILFPKQAYQIVHTWKDNTGEKKYIEDMAFPTLSFPSDHGILATIIEPRS
jgi:hypothetical protein